MDLSLEYCFLAVDDHDAALAFYCDVLGFTVRADVGRGAMRWVTVSPPSQPEVRIVLEPPLADPNASEADRAAVTTLMAKGMFGRIVFAIADCDAVFAHVAASGADVVQEPIDQAFGVRDCAFRDPAGNLVRFNQPLKP